MSVQHLTESKQLVEHGRRLGRDGLSQRVEALVLSFIREGGYKNAMILAGRMRALCAAVGRDDYWREQVNKGWTRELSDIRTFNAVDPDEDHDFDRIRQLSEALALEDQEWPPSPELASKEDRDRAVADLRDLADFAQHHGFPGLSEKATRAGRLIESLSKSFLEACADNDRLRNAVDARAAS